MKKALNEYEWHIFNSAMVDSQTRGFRVDDNGILISNQNDAYSYKLVFYDDFEDGPQIQEVYKLENYDYNMHSDELNIVKFLSDYYNGKDKLEYDERRKIFHDYLYLSGTILKNFNKRTCRWNTYNGKKSGRSSEISEPKLERRTDDGSTKENKTKGSDTLRRLKGQSLGANLPGKKFSVFEDGTEKNLVAMHNLSADNLEIALKRGGLPMPSIAITKDSISHNDFGDVSVLFYSLFLERYLYKLFFYIIDVFGI